MADKNNKGDKIDMQETKFLNTKMNDSSHFLPAILAIALSVFRFAPKSIPGWIYLILCTVLAYQYIAPFVVTTAEFFSNYYSFLGFLNPKLYDPVEPLIYVLVIAFAYPIMSLLGRLFQIILPDAFANWFKGKINGSAEDTES